MATEQERNKALVLQMYEEVWNKGNFQFINTVVAPDFKDHAAHRFVPLPDRGREALIEAATNFRHAMPDLRDQIIQIVAEEDRVVYLGMITGTHTANYLQFPASGNKINVQEINDFRLKDGKIVERWGLFNVMAMMQQMGVVPGGH